MTVFVNPFVRINGVVKMIDKIDVEISAQPLLINQNRGATFANESVLKSGTWYSFQFIKQEFLN